MLTATPPGALPATGASSGSRGPAVMVLTLGVLLVLAVWGAWERSRTR
jgi:hypothetical protein